jgi:hypothetical protein
MKRIFTFVACGLLAGGCGEATIDASSEERFSASVAEVKKQLPVERWRDFEAAIMAIEMQGTNARERLHGLDADGVLKLGREAEEQNNTAVDAELQRTHERLRQLEGDMP